MLATKLFSRGFAVAVVVSVSDGVALSVAETDDDADIKCATEEIWLFQIVVAKIFSSEFADDFAVAVAVGDVDFSIAKNVLKIMM